VRFVDTNVFVRYLAPSAPDDQLFLAAQRVFDDPDGSREPFTTTDAVIAEVIYVLGSETLYHQSRSEIVTGLGALLRLDHCQIPRKSVFFEALFLWGQGGRISFVDALCLAHSIDRNDDLVTFDTALARIAQVQRWDRRTWPSQST
jgi:predicted nucleic acid-binding protein